MRSFSAAESVSQFDVRLPSVGRVALDEKFIVSTVDCYDGQIPDESVLRTSIDFHRFNRATGPIDIDGVSAGDWIAIEILGIELSDKGIMVVSPELGILGSRITHPSTMLVPVDCGFVEIDGVQVPVHPMIGVIGVASEAPAKTERPGRHGGNLDTRILTEGCTVLLQAQRDGAGLAIGDLHAAQGDGELGGTGVEISGSVKIRVSRATYLGRWPAIVHERTLWIVSSGMDLEQAVSVAFDEAVTLVQNRTRVSWESAYRIASVSAQLAISQVVNPLVTVRLGLPLDLVPELS